jgi:hypothetical protein
VHKTAASDCSVYTKVRRNATQHWSHKSGSVTVVTSVAATSIQEHTVQTDKESAFDGNPRFVTDLNPRQWLLSYASCILPTPSLPVW